MSPPKPYQHLDDVREAAAVGDRPEHHLPVALQGHALGGTCHECLSHSETVMMLGGTGANLMDVSVYPTAGTPWADDTSWMRAPERVRRGQPVPAELKRNRAKAKAARRARRVTRG